MRFRKSIQIGKGIRLNFSKSGVSLTVGGKGVSANVGKKGVYVNTSIPGTGLYDRKKILDFGGDKARTPAKAAPRLQGVDMPAQVRMDVTEDGALLIYDETGAPITEKAVLDRLNAMPGFREQCDAILAQRMELFNAATEAFVNIGAQSAEVAPGKAGADDRDAVEDAIEAWLGAVELPIEFHVDFEYDPDDGVLLADLDLPEIEHLPTRHMVEQASGKLKARDKTQKELKQEYTRCVFGLGMFCASHFFSLAPGLERVLLSAYTQRRDSRGDLKDDYIYSVIYERAAFEHSGYQQTEPEAFALRFKNRVNKAAAGDLKTIKPYGPADL